MYSLLSESPVMEKTFFVLKIVGVLSSTEMRSCVTPPGIPCPFEMFAIKHYFELCAFYQTILTISLLYLQLFAKRLFCELLNRH